MLPVFAYFDPGAGSIVLQALVGGSAGLWVAVRYWWSRPKDDSRSLMAKSNASSNAEIDRHTAI
jgi:hypothetical protein